MTIEERRAEKVAKGWTPLEAEELVDIEDGKLLPEEAELVNCVTSDSPRPQTFADKDNPTTKQKENLEYLKSRVLETWANERAALTASQGEQT